MQSQSTLFSSSVATTTSSHTQALSRKEQALEYMTQLERAFKKGAYGAPDKPFEQALRGLLSLLKSCLGGATPAERMDNPTHLLVRLLTLMSEDALRNLSNETLRTEYAAVVHAALDLIVVQSYEESWVSLPKALRTTQGEVSLLNIITEFNRGDASVPRQYELDCCKENIQALLEKKSDWTRAFEVMKLAIAQDAIGLLRYANELRKEIRPLWPVTVLLFRRLTPLAQQSPKVLTVLQTAMAEECQRTQFHCHYAAQEALAEVVAFSKGADKATIRRQALGQRTTAEETKAVRKQPTYWYWAQTRPAEKVLTRFAGKQEDRCRYRLMQGVSELLVQELESKESNQDKVDVLNQLMEMLFYLQETEPAYLKEAQGWIRALSDKVHRDKPKAYVLSGFAETHPNIEKTHLGDEQKRLQEELRCMQLDAKAQREELEKAKQEKHALALEKDTLLKNQAAWKQQEATLQQDKAKLEEDKAVLTKRTEVDQKQLESLKRQCARVKKQLETAEATQHDLLDELSGLRQETDPTAMRDRMQELEGELKAEQTKVKQLSLSVEAGHKELQEKTQQLQQKEKALEKDRAALTARQQALEQAEATLAAQTAALKAEQAKLEERVKALDAQEAYLRAQAEELREKEASLQSLEKVFELQLQDIERGLKKLTISPTASLASSTRPGSTTLSSPTSPTVAQRLMALRQEQFDEAFRKQAEDISEDVIGIDFRCASLKRPAYDALTLRLATKEGYEEEHLISEEAAREWLIGQQKTTCPCCSQEVVGIGINRLMRKMVMDKIQSASPKKPASAISIITPKPPTGRPAAVLPTSPVFSPAAIPSAPKDKDIKQAVPLSPSGTPSTTGVFKRMPEAPEQSLDAKSMQEAKEVLEHVAWGRQDEAEALLKAKPWLAFVRGEVEEPCSRKWKRVSPFELAVWGLDWHMWEMMLRCFRDEDYVKAAEQYQELEAGKGEHGKQFSLQPLIEALQTYSKKFDGWTEQQRQDHWQKIVGGEQGKLPMSVVHEYCRPDRSFEKRDGMFEEKALPRWKGREKEWFHLDNAKEGVNYKYTIGGKGGAWAWIRGGSINAKTCSAGEKYLRVVRERFSSVDNGALLAMTTARDQQKSKLGQIVSAKRPSAKGLR